MSNESIELFISYSHKDEALRDELATHLAIMQRQGEITTWYDRQIGAGSEWANQIDNNLKKADIILLLISSYFLASDYCYDIELKLAMERHEAGEALVVPIILRPVNWFGASFGKLQAYPKDAKPVTSWANQDEAFLSVIQGIGIAANNLRELRQQKFQQKEAAINQYKKKVEEALSDGKISLPERDTLDELRDELGLTPEEVNEIEKLAFEPWKKYEENLQKYQKTLIKVIEYEYPFSDETQKDLELRQRDLGIKSEDVARIEKPILAQAKAKYQEKLQTEQSQIKQQQDSERVKQLELQKQQEKEEYKNKLRHYEQEFLKAIEGEYPISEIVRNKINGWQQSLGLKAEDIAHIEHPILAQAKAKYQRQVEAEQKAERPQKLEAQQQKQWETQKQHQPTKKHYQSFTELIGHSKMFAGVRSVAISPDGKIIASGSEDYTIKLWNLETKREIRTLSGHSHFVRAVAFSPDGDMVISGSTDKTIKLWNWKTGQEIGTLANHSKPVTTVAISPDGETLASGSHDKTIKLWSLKSRQEICTFSGHSNYIQSVAFSPDGQTLASGGNDYNIKLWSLSTHKEILSLADSASVHSITISPDKQTLVSGNFSSEVKLWNLSTGKLRQTLSGHSYSFFGGYGVLSAAISPDGQILASGCDSDKTIKLWNLATGKLLQTLSGHSKGVTSVVFSPDGQTLISGSYDKTVRVWY